MKLKLISKQIHCFNEDTNHVEDFYLNDWENNGDQVENGSYATVGVTIQFFCNITCLTDYHFR